jgi:predicted nucleic-acid-binding protein
VRAADTNVIVRIVTGDDEDQTATAEAVAGAGLWVSHAVLLELAWVLRSTFGRDRAYVGAMLDLLLTNPDLTIQDPDVVRAAVAHLRAHPGVEFADCMILETARKGGCLPLVTFDRRLAKLPGVERL